MKGLYQILSEDYRDYQLKEPIRKHSKQLIESTRPSKLKEQAKLNEACEDKKEEVIKGSEEADKKSIVKEDEDIEEISENLPIEDEITIEEDPEAPVEPTAVEKISNVALLSKDEIEAEMAEMNDEEKEALKEQFEAIKNVAMELFPEEVEEEIEEIKEEPEIKESEEVPAEPINEEVKEEAVEPVVEENIDTSTSADPIEEVAVTEEAPVEAPVEEPVAEVPVENTEVIPEEPLQECEISSFKVTRIAPKFGAVMIEAQTKDGLKYITGKNFNESEKTLDEAEIAADKLSASNRFKSLLK